MHESSEEMGIDVDQKSDNMGRGVRFKGEFLP